MAMTFGLILPRMLFERFLPRPHEPGTDVLGIAIISKNNAARSCIQCCRRGSHCGIHQVNR
jgi:hypothetical protein